MTAEAEKPRRPEAPTFAELFTPKLVTVLREGYDFSKLRADAFAGLTIAIVALPLSMAIAIAAGVSPDRGVITAIIGGFLVSLLGGSRFQIGGPSGAVIVLAAATVMREGVDGLILATAMAGVILMAAGLLRLGTYIKFIPYPVTVGFTAAIAMTIFASQLSELFGLTLPAHEPGALLPKLLMLIEAAPTVNPAAIGIALLTIGLIVGIQRIKPALPGMLVAVVVASAVTAWLSLPVDTIGTRFGGIARGLPFPALPALSLDKMQSVLPEAIAFALLAAIESLLSAVVADGMSGRRHRSNCELVAQGIANIGSALFGGFCVTGTMARTATNVRAGAVGPISGMLHSVFLLAFILIAAPLARFVPLAALAGVLAVVAWNMAERHAFATLLRSSVGDAIVLLVTFGLVAFRDLTEGIVVGFALGALLFIDRMAKSIAVEAEAPIAEDDVADTSGRTRGEYEPVAASDPDTVVYRISGAFFFGAASTVGAVLDRIGDRHRNFILDCSSVPHLDSTAANVLQAAARKAQRENVRFFITGASPQVRRTLLVHGVRPPLVTYAPTVAAARSHVRSQAVPPG